MPGWGSCPARARDLRRHELTHNLSALAVISLVTTDEGNDMTTTPARRRRSAALLATAAIAAVLLTGCGDDTGTAATPSPSVSPDATSEAPEPPTSPAAPVAPVATVAPAVAVDPLAGFPLTAGWGELTAEPGYGGTEFPVDDLSHSFSSYACAGPTPRADTTDVLRGQVTGPEYYASRELLVLPDADAAVAHLGALQAFYEDCPEQRGDGTSYPLRVFDTELGSASFGVVRTSVRDDGTPETGLMVLQATRVGRSVLLDVSVGDGIATSEADARALTDFRAEQSAPVVAAMCAFTEAGC